MSEHINELYDKEGNLIGCLLSAEAWQLVKSDMGSALGLDETKIEPEIKEPIADWETLKEYWDFNYPVDMDVHCDLCDNSTQDWSTDTPRKFILTAACLSGLVSFTCSSCHAKILKKHFKDEIVSECTQFQDSKDSKKEAKY